MNKKVLFSSTVACVALVAYLVGTSTPAVSIPESQESCAFDSRSLTVGGTRRIPGTQVTIDNGSVARDVIVQFSADTGVDEDAEVRISYMVDGVNTGEDVYGPANLANHQQFFEARAVIAVIPLGPGVHTIQPAWRVSGAPGKTAHIDSRCFTAEGQTS